MTTVSVDRAVLSRGRVVYATGIAARSVEHPQLVLSSTSTLRPGRYALTVRWTTKRTSHTTRQTIMLL